MHSEKAEVLEAVVQHTAHTTGTDFFRSLTRSIARALQVRYCFITECLNQPPSRVRTLAFWAGDSFAENFEYEVFATPCEKVLLDGQGAVYGQGIQELFPDDQDLVDLEAESYAAVPMIGTSHPNIGHLVVLDDRPFGNRAPDLALLEMFAARGASELERQRATEALARSEARLRQVIDLVPHFIFAKDLDGRFILANQASAEVYGTTVQELIGRSDADFSATPEEVEKFRRDDREVLESGSKVIEEETITDSEGNIRYLQTTKIPFSLADSKLPSILGVSIDITDQRRSQERLKAVMEGTASSLGEAFLRSLTRHLAAALETRYAVVAELAGPMVRARAVWAGEDFADPLTYSLAGSPCEQVVARRSPMFCPEGVQRTFPTLELLQKLGAESYLGMPLLDTEGQPIGLLAVLDDQPMQESVRARQLLSIFASRAAAELERERMETHRIHLQAQVLHGQKLESLGVLAGGIAHDFNNLLSSILGNVDLARLYLPEGAGAHQFLEEIERAAQRSADLSNQMLAYSGKAKLVRGRFDLNALIDEMAGLLRTSISKKVTLHVDLSPQLPHLEGDATQIRQIVMNLITNASDACGSHAGSIYISTEPRQLDRGYLQSAILGERLSPGDYLVLEVRDTGCGMDPETRNRLFDPFFTTKKDGRGLGLAALLGILRGHKGAVRVESEPGKGSRFEILLPVPGSIDPARAATGRSPQTSWRGEGTILLVDDERTIRIVTRRLLENLGFRVLLAENGREAIEVFRQHAEGLRAVVLDLMMPEVDGMETLRTLREMRPELRVLLSSGYPQQESTAAAVKDDLTGFLKKPYRVHELQDAMRRLLEG